MSYSVLASVCRNCPEVSTCTYKLMEAVAEFEEPEAENAAAPLLCERKNGPLSSFPYKDELQKELSKALTINPKMFGAK